jgi:hypothetical protein
MHPTYAQAFAEFGAPIELRACGGWILRRRIPESDRYDATSCYPLFTCSDWTELASDLMQNPADLVSLTLVLDPFDGYEPAALTSDFDVVVPLEHFVTELRQPIEEIATRHHRKYALRALRRVEVERCDNPPSLLDTWTTLYAHLVERHSITGIRAFSRASFAKQLQVPGLVMFRAIREARTVAIHLWYLHDHAAYSHLLAIAEEGYRLDASYALQWHAMNYFRGRVPWLDLGGAPKFGARGGAGLAYFKQGWATATRPAFLAGRVYDQATYRAETERRGISTSGYFPAYRQGEFGPAPVARAPLAELARRSAG